jgi:hypothetical protein
MEKQVRIEYWRMTPSGDMKVYADIWIDSKYLPLSENEQKLLGGMLDYLEIDCKLGKLSKEEQLAAFNDIINAERTIPYNPDRAVLVAADWGQRIKTMREKSKSKKWLIIVPAILVAGALMSIFITKKWGE